MSRNSDDDSGGRDSDGDSGSGDSDHTEESEAATSSGTNLIRPGQRRFCKPAYKTDDDTPIGPMLSRFVYPNVPYRCRYPPGLPTKPTGRPLAKPWRSNGSNPGFAIHNKHQTEGFNKEGLHSALYKAIGTKLAGIDGVHFTLLREHVESLSIKSPFQMIESDILDRVMYLIQQQFTTLTTNCQSVVYASVAGHDDLRFRYVGTNRMSFQIIHTGQAHWVVSGVEPLDTEPLFVINPTASNHITDAMLSSIRQLYCDNTTLKERSICAYDAQAQGVIPTSNPPIRVAIHHPTSQSKLECGVLCSAYLVDIAMGVSKSDLMLTRFGPISSMYAHLAKIIHTGIISKFPRVGSRSLGSLVKPTIKVIDQ